MELTASRPSTPVWLWVVGGLGMAWNLYGVIQFAGSFNQTQDSLMTAGMSAEQARVYFELPAWTKIAFAIGVFGGLAGCIALLARNKNAVPIFLISLIGYVALFTGDILHGLFAVLPSQLGILLVVVAVAVILYGASLVAKRREYIS